MITAVATQYYVRVRNGPEAGPMSATAIRNLIRSDAFGPEDCIRKDGSATWNRLGSVPQLAAEFPNSMPPESDAQRSRAFEALDPMIYPHEIPAQLPTPRGAASPPPIPQGGPTRSYLPLESSTTRGAPPPIPQGESRSQPIAVSDYGQGSISTAKSGGGGQSKFELLPDETLLMEGLVGHVKSALNVANANCYVTNHRIVVCDKGLMGPAALGGVVGIGVSLLMKTTTITFQIPWRELVEVSRAKQLLFETLKFRANGAPEYVIRFSSKKEDWYSAIRTASQRNF